MTGIDIVKIERMEKAFKNSAFQERVFTCYENAYIASRANPYETAAGLFAAKEAVLKALGCGINSVSDLKKVEITHGENGAPKVSVSECVKCSVNAADREIYISVSHDGEYAVASAYIR